MYSLTPPLNLTKCLLKLKEHWGIIVPQQFLKGPLKQLDWMECFFKDLQKLSKLKLYSKYCIYICA
jgi:hypothetical protein